MSIDKSNSESIPLVISSILSLTLSRPLTSNFASTSQSSHSSVSDSATSTSIPGLLPFLIVGDVQSALTKVELYNCDNLMRWLAIFALRCVKRIDLINVVC